MNRIFRCLLLVLILAALLPRGATAVVTATAEWNWADYRSDVDGGPSTDLSHFYQQYSLLYQHRQGIQGGNAGFWKVGLGYEWTAIDTSGAGYDANIDNGKILYEGELSFTPRVLPLSFHAYSHDLARSQARQLTSGYLISPGIDIGLYNGEHIANGFTLIVGESTLAGYGGYRGNLTAFPRLLVDFSEINVRDTEGTDDPAHYRIRDLAMVSLNRKHNWFHYKMFEYTDYIDPVNNEKERVLLLGTVDHLDRRQWINLTNWLKISVDGSLSRYEGVASEGLTGKEEVYRLNLFNEGKRQDWRYANYTGLARRTTNTGELDKEFDFPVYASGQLDPLNKWRFAFLGSRWEEKNQLTLSDLRKEDSVYARYQLESQRSADLLLIPGAEAEWGRTFQEGVGRGARLAVELRNDDPLKIKRRNWRLYYSVARFEHEADDFAGRDPVGAGDSAVFHEQSANAALTLRLSESATFSCSQELAIGSGDYAANGLDHIGSTIARGYRGDPADEERTLSGTVWRSTTDLALELTPPGRWRNLFSAYYDHIDEDGTVSHQTQGDHDLVYSRGNFYLRGHTRLAEGDGLSWSWDSRNISPLDYRLGAPDWFLSHGLRVDYSPNPYWFLKGEGGAIWGEGNRGEGGAAYVKEATTFHLYESVGVPRRWLSFTQEFRYDKAWGRQSLWFAELGASVNYYPTRYLSLNAGIDMKHYSITDINEFRYELSAVASFRKLQANVSYIYGQIEDDAFFPGIREQRWEVGLKKIF